MVAQNCREEHDMSDIDRVVDAYISIWNETDGDRRRELIAQTWTEEATYVDPVLKGDGPAGIDAMTASAQAQFPGHAFRRTGAADAHHDWVRFGWELVNVASGEPLIAGIDVAQVAPDGRLRSIVGFLDRVPDLVEAEAS